MTLDINEHMKITGNPDENKHCSFCKIKEKDTSLIILTTKEIFRPKPLFLCPTCARTIVILIADYCI